MNADRPPELPRRDRRRSAELVDLVRLERCIDTPPAELLCPIFRRLG
jgi:hypothetical protein